MENTFTLNLVSMLVGDLNRLRYIQRFGTALVLHKENVAEHSYYVAMYAYFIGQWCQGHGVDIDLFQVLEASLFHDLEEARTGDFPRPFKYRRPDLKVLLDRAAETEFGTIIQEILPGREPLLAHIQGVWHHARDEAFKEGCVVALADYLSVISHLWQEVNCSNASMLQHYESVMAYLEEFEKSCYDFMREIILEVRRITTAVFDKSRTEGFLTLGSTPQKGLF